MIGAFRIDLLDPTTRQKVGDFPITTATRVSRQEGLDRIGKWSFDMSITDPALPAIEGKDFAIYWLSGQATFFLGECSYLDHQVTAARSVQVSAAGRLRDLQRQTVLQRSFNGASSEINDVLEVIVPLRPGWALGAVDTVAKPAPLDFWYETVFDSVGLLASTFGLHFREGSAPRTLDFGAMGAESGVLAVGGEELTLSPEIYTNPDLALVSSLSVAYQSSTVVNRLIPFGGAVGVATIGLRETTATQAGYPVQSAALPGGGSFYYIEDAESVAQYGLTERRFLRKDLRPISNSPAAREFAANVLYEAALASLLNLKNRQTVYDLAVTNWTPGRVRVGDKIRVLYRGVVETWSGSQVWLNLDDPAQPGRGKAFYVLEVNETFGDGVTAQIKINENAVHEETVEDLLASTIRQFEQSQIHVQPTISRYTVGPYTKRVSASPAVSASFSFQLGPETLNVWYVKIQVSGEPLKSSVTAASSGGGSTQSSSNGGGGTQTSSSGGGGSTTSESGGGGTTQSGPVGTHRHLLSGEPGWTGETAWAHSHPLPTHSHTVNLPSHRHDVSIPNHSHTVTIPAHTHPLQYGIFQDTVSPATGNIRVNGTLVASGVSLANYELDITSRILAAANLQQNHTITVECSNGRGEITFQAQVLAVIQAIAI